jgi:hypothetical protein
MNFNQAPEFAKEQKKLSKKWRRLPKDLLVLQAAIVTLYKGVNGLPVTHIREAFFSTKKGAVLTVLSGDSEVVKVRLDSRDLDSDKLRVTYIQSGDNILFVELFAKNEKFRENQERITKYTKEISKNFLRLD